MIPAATTRVRLDPTRDLFRTSSQRPDHLGDVAIGELRHELRLLLCHDGTLTTALEALLLTAVNVQTRLQEPVRLNSRQADLLRAEAGARAIARQVLIGEQISSRPLVHAHALLLLERLPGSFPELLSSRLGVGGAIRHLELETRRELLWVGIGNRTLVRSYRVITEGLPAILIEESFPLDTWSAARDTGPAWDAGL